LRVYGRGFGGADTRLGEVTCDGQGHYTLTYAPVSDATNLQVSAVDAQGKEIPLSDIKYAADSHVLLTGSVACMNKRANDPDLRSAARTSSRSRQPVWSIEQGTGPPRATCETSSSVWTSLRPLWRS
jgi:hypothetical protein